MMKKIVSLALAMACASSLVLADVNDVVILDEQDTEFVTRALENPNGVEASFFKKHKVACYVVGGVVVVAGTAACVLGFHKGSRAYAVDNVVKFVAFAKNAPKQIKALFSKDKTTKAVVVPVEEVVAPVEEVVAPVEEVVAPVEEVVAPVEEVVAPVEEVVAPVVSATN